MNKNVRGIRRVRPAFPRLPRGDRRWLAVAACALVLGCKPNEEGQEPKSRVASPSDVATQPANASTGAAAADGVRARGRADEPIVIVRPDAGVKRRGTEPDSTGGPAEGPSNDGTYIVAFRPEPEPIPMNEPFDLHVTVRAADGEAVEGVALAADAAMPAHGHGMNRAPVVRRAEDGVWVVSGMLFHMPGHWELYLDITRGAITERAQFDVNLE